MESGAPGMLVDVTDRYDEFLALHRPGEPLVIPNPWDIGSARILAAAGFAALATTSSGNAATRGLPDGALTRAQALSHAAEIVAATPLPVSADLENGFAHEPVDVAHTIDLALAAGLAGCSIEDASRERDEPIYENALAVDRVRAAAEAAHAGPRRLVLTARAENYLYGHADLAGTIARLQAFADAGADVLYAPGLSDAGEIAEVVRAVDRPVNVLLLGRGPSVAELAQLGVARVSVGGALAYVAYGALAEAAAELHAGGSSWLGRVAAGRTAAADAFPS